MKGKLMNGTQYGQKKILNSQYPKVSDDDLYQLPRFQEVLSQVDRYSQASRSMATLEHPPQYQKNIKLFKANLNNRAPID